MSARFTTTRRVEFCDTDTGGILHFSNFYRFMEQAEHEFFRSLGLSIHQHEQDGTTITWPRVAAACEFESPAFFEDVIEVRMTIARMGKKSLTTECEFYRDGALLARGRMTSVCCRVSTNQPIHAIDIPPRYRNLIGPAKHE